VDETLVLTPKEQDRLNVMKQLAEKELTQTEAATKLGIGVRQVKRLWRAYRKLGAAGLASKKRGGPGNHRLDAGVLQQALTLLQERYRRFGPTLAHEKLTEVEHLSLSVESVRQLMITAKLWHPKRARQRDVHPLRERRACWGELVQVDGCWHRWFEERGPACTLLAFIDDATGQIMQLMFTHRETTFAYMQAMSGYLQRYGRPVTLYTDRLSVFRVNAKHPTTTLALTQFARAMQDLDIEILCANSPQAKGRVERLHQTLQDRLVKEMWLRGISDLEAGNAYLPEFCADFNARFGVVPRSNHDAHRPLRPDDDLEHILSHQETRALSKNLTIQFQRVIYQIQSPRPSYALRGAQVTVCQHEENDAIRILYKQQPLAFTVFQPQPRQAEIASTKDIQAMESRAPRAPYVPPPDHPWRRIGDRVDPRPTASAP
jgi:transposase